MLSINDPDFVYRPWTPAQRAARAKRTDRTVVGIVTIAFRAYCALMKPLKSDYRCVGGAGRRSKPRTPRTIFRVAADGAIRAMSERGA